MRVLNWLEKMFDKRNGVLQAALLFALIPLLLTGCAPTISDEAREPIWAIKLEDAEVAYGFSCGVAAVRNSAGQYYYIEKNGELWGDETFQEIKIFHNFALQFLNGLSLVEVDGEDRFLYRSGKLLDMPPPGITKAYSADEPLKGAADEERWGYVNSQYLWEIRPRYYDVSSFENGYSITVGNNTQRSGDYGYFLVTEDGEVTDFSQFDEVISCEEDYVIVIQEDGTYGYADLTGEIILSGPYEDVQPFSEGLSAVKIEGQWGYIDTSGTVVIQPQFADAGNFSEGYAYVVREDGKFNFLDREGNLCLDWQSGEVQGEFHGGAIPVKRQDLTRWGLAGLDGKWVLKPFWGYSKITWDETGHYRIYDGEREGWYDPDTGVETGLYDQAYPYLGHYAIVQRGGNWGCIDWETGEEVIPIEQKRIYGYSEGLLAVEGENWKIGYMDLEGNWVIQPQFQTANIFSEGLAVVRGTDGTYGYIANPLLYSEWQADSLQRAEQLGFVCEDCLGDAAATGYVLKNLLLQVEERLQAFQIVRAENVDSIWTDEPLTRGDAAVLLEQYIADYGVETGAYQCFFFDDLPEEERPSIAFCAAQGLFDLSSDWCFYPDEVLTVEDVQSIAVKTFEYLGDLNEQEMAQTIDTKNTIDILLGGSEEQ